MNPCSAKPQLIRLVLPPLMLAGMTACGLMRTESPQPTPTPAHLSAEACTDPNLPLGGGMVQVGDFLFDLWPYCDPSLSAEPLSPDHSAITDLAVYMSWSYNGPTLEEDYLQDFRCADESLGEFGTGHGLHKGSVGSYSGAVLLAQSSLQESIATGAAIICEAKVTIAGLPQSARLSFVLNKTPGGLELSPISVQPGTP
jgi:hypothetical protein